MLFMLYEYNELNTFPLLLKCIYSLCGPIEMMPLILELLGWFDFIVSYNAIKSTRIQASKRK